MSTTLISPNRFQAAWLGHPTAADGRAPFEMVKAFGSRVFSIAHHITQNDDDAGDILIDTFLEVCPNLDGFRDDEKVWLRLVTVAVREAFSRLGHRHEDRPLVDAAPDPSEDLVILEFSVWGDIFQQDDSLERKSSVLEQGLRSLGPMCRTVFVLRDIEEISLEHIAAIVNRSEAAIEVCLLRARLQLREMLARHMRRQQ